MVVLELLLGEKSLRVLYPVHPVTLNGKTEAQREANGCLGSQTSGRIRSHRGDSKKGREDLRTWEVQNPIVITAGSQHQAPTLSMCLWTSPNVSPCPVREEAQIRGDRCPLRVPSHLWTNLSRVHQKERGAPQQAGDPDGDGGQWASEELGLEWDHGQFFIYLYILISVTKGCYFHNKEIKWQPHSPPHLHYSHKSLLIVKSLISLAWSHYYPELTLNSAFFLFTISLHIWSEVATIFFSVTFHPSMEHSSILSPYQNPYHPLRSKVSITFFIMSFPIFPPRSKFFVCFPIMFCVQWSYINFAHTTITIGVYTFIFPSRLANL